MMMILYTALLAQFFCLILFFIRLKNFKKSTLKTQNKFLILLQKNQTLLYEIDLRLSQLVQFNQWPSQLEKLPLADQGGMILSIQSIEIPGVAAPYNGALIRSAEKNYLCFRSDELSIHFPLLPHLSKIGLIELGEDFEPIEKAPCFLETGSSFSEDGRIFQSGSAVYLIYNDMASLHKSERIMKIGEIDLAQRKLKYTTSLTPSFSQKIEKNWTPFSFQNQIHFLYTINPQKILALPNPEQNRLIPLFSSDKLSLKWEQKWGAVRGGTPATQINGEYFAFFHSSFEDRKGIRWYAMGAYTFASRPPFCLTKVSPYPILFEKAYQTPHLGQASPKIRALYPMGFIQGQKEGRSCIHLSCGENDSRITILTFDQEPLMSSLADC